MRNVLIFIICSCILNITSQYCYSEALPSLSYYEVIEQRNIFRPKNEGAATALENKVQRESSSQRQTDSEGIGDISLTGIIKLRGQFKAIIEKKNQKSGFYVSVGDNIDDYTVGTIERDRVTLKKDGKTFILKINIEKGSPENSTKSNSDDIRIEIGSGQEQNNQIDNENFKSNVIQNIRRGTPVK